MATTLIADRFTYPATAFMAGENTWIRKATFAELNDSTSIEAGKLSLEDIRQLVVDKGEPVLQSGRQE